MKYTSQTQAVPKHLGYKSLHCACFAGNTAQTPVQSLLHYPLNLDAPPGFNTLNTNPSPQTQYKFTGTGAHAKYTEQERDLQQFPCPFLSFGP